MAGSPEGTHAAPLSYAKAATGFLKQKVSPYDSRTDSRAGAAKHATLFDESPEEEGKLRGSSQISGSPQLENRQLSRDIPHDTQPYRDYAAGGYVESDKALAALGEREAAKAQGKRLDEENFRLLFSDPADAVLVERIEKMTLVRTKSNGKGGSRGLWSGTYELLSSKNASSGTKEEAGSLLDS